jgi:hypothetical protein
MLTRLRTQFGTAGLVVAVVALVAAVGGTALAASGALTGKQKKEVEKIAKKFQGTGPAGPAGKDGTNGTNGSPGKAGVDGANGEGVAISAASSADCVEGGTKLANSSGSGLACNGEEGAPGIEGPEGEPWTAGGTLPPGAVETGFFYGVGGQKGVPTEYKNGEGNDVKTEVFVGTLRVKTAISFFIPLTKRVTKAHVFYGIGTNAEDIEENGEIKKTTFTEHCPGTSYLEPKVLNAGELCVYESSADPSTASFLGAFQTGATDLTGTTTVGATLKWNPPPEADSTEVEVSGTWAVKGCNPGSAPDQCP